MNVLYDYQTLTMQRFGGISRYFYELANRLSKKEDVCVDVKTVFNANYYFKDYFEKEKAESLPWLFSKANNCVNRLYVLSQNKGKYDVIHSTYYHPYILNKFKGKYVVTIHDMIYELYKNILPKSKKIIENKRKHIFAADKIICVSEWTKNDLLKIYPSIDESKLEVIYHGNNIKCNDSVDVPKIDKLKMVKKYILFTGNRTFYKNFKNFAIAISDLIKDDDDLWLVCGGGGVFSESEKQFLSEYGIINKSIQVKYDDSEAVSLYRNAECFVFPSLYEGFGIPILEAWECHCPVVLSNASCFPEIAADACEYFDGNSCEDIKNSVKRVLYNDTLKSEMVSKGICRSNSFSWNITADKTLDLYKRLL